MYATTVLRRLGLYVALWLVYGRPCECRASLRGQLRLRTRSQTRSKLKTLMLAEQPSCKCEMCIAQRKITDTRESGGKGFQCKPKGGGSEDEGQGLCRQPGDASMWVVQSVPANGQITIERFCYYSCKPEILKQLSPDFKCIPLTPAEVQLAQTPENNGRAFIWHMNPVTDSQTLFDMKLSEFGIPDMTKNLEKAVTQVKFYTNFEKMKADAAAAKSAAESKEIPPKPGFCMCRCPEPPTTTGPLPPYNPFKTPPPLPAAPPKAPGLPPPPPPPPVPPPPLPGPPPLPPLPMVLPSPAMAGPTLVPPPPPTLQPTPPPPATTTWNNFLLYAEAHTKLTKNATAGSTVLEVESTDGFFIGEEIEIDNPVEKAKIVGLGSIQLEKPLQFPHIKGSLVAYRTDFETTKGPDYFDQKFPKRFDTEINSMNEPAGPFAPTYGPHGPPTTTFPAALGWGPSPAAPGMFGMFGTTTTGMYGMYGTTTGMYGATTSGAYGMATTSGAYGGTTPYAFLQQQPDAFLQQQPEAPPVLLDMTSASSYSLPLSATAMPAFTEAAMPQLSAMPVSMEAATPQIPPMPEMPPIDVNMLQLTNAGLPSAVVPPVSFLQESMQSLMSSTFQSAVPVNGCDCECTKHEAAVEAANRNAMAMSAFPEEGEAVPWGHGVYNAAGPV